MLHLLQNKMPDDPYTLKDLTAAVCLFSLKTVVIITGVSLGIAWYTWGILHAVVTSAVGVSRAKGIIAPTTFPGKNTSHAVKKEEK